MRRSLLIWLIIVRMVKMFKFCPSAPSSKSSKICECLGILMINTSNILWCMCIYKSSYFCCDELLTWSWSSFKVTSSSLNDNLTPAARTSFIFQRTRDVASRSTKWEYVSLNEKAKYRSMIGFEVFYVLRLMTIRKTIFQWA